MRKFVGGLEKIQIRKRKANWIARVLRKDGLQKSVIEGKIREEEEEKGRELKC